MKVRTFLLTHTNRDYRRTSIETIRQIPFRIAQVILIGYHHHTYSTFLPSGSFSSQCPTIENRVMAWCEENCAGQFSMVRHKYFVGFELDDDAIMFKLVWG